METRHGVGKIAIILIIVIIIIKENNSSNNRFNYIQYKIDDRCKTCGLLGETVCHILSVFEKLARKNIKEDIKTLPE